MVDFWAQNSRHWFSKNPSFDRRFRERFLGLHQAAARGEFDDWIDDPTGALALMVLLDQFPRNAFRGTARMYATDALALRLARQALALGHMQRVEAPLRLFFCLPFAHAESLADQEVSVRLNTLLGPGARAHAERHRDIIRCFGRFPHRNPLLQRPASDAERAFLAAGGFAG